jgi:hypothetical protein
MGQNEDNAVSYDSVAWWLSSRIHTLTVFRAHGRRFLPTTAVRTYRKVFYFPHCLFSWLYNPLWLYFHSPVAGFKPPGFRGFLITHNDAPQSVGLLWTSDQSVAVISTGQHTILTTNIHSPGGIGTHDLSRRAAEDLRLRPATSHTICDKTVSYRSRFYIFQLWLFVHKGYMHTLNHQFPLILFCYFNCSISRRNYNVRSQYCEKRLLALSCLQGTTRLPMDVLSWNLMFEYFSRIRHENSSFINIRQEQRALYVKTYLHLRQCLGQFFLKREIFQTKF